MTAIVALHRREVNAVWEKRQKIGETALGPRRRPQLFLQQLQFSWACSV